MKNKQGKVFIVGAGPGDIDLITKRGWDVLQQAEVVVMDALVNPGLVRDTKARMIGAGKRGPGAPHGASVELPQSKINDLLVRLARQGKRVVRLKGGDPFVFGRGSEELDVLQKNNIPYEVVPGVSSAIAAPAYAGIPITDRRWASQVTFITGHPGKGEAGPHSKIDWKRISPHGTLVVLMGVHQWPTIQKKLLSNGWKPTVPVVAIESASTALQRTVSTRLKESARIFKLNVLVSPAVVVVGEVAKLSQTLGWVHKTKPLLGRKIVVTRALEQSFQFVQALKDLGADVLVSPAIRMEPLSPHISDEQIKKSDWMIFLSNNAVEHFARVLGPRTHQLKSQKILAIGPRTAAAVRARGWRVAAMAKDFNSFGVANVLGNVQGKKILIPRVEKAPPVLSRLLKKAGARVTEVATYQTLPVAPTAVLKKTILTGVDAITFTSGSTARYLLKYFTKKERSHIFKRAAAVSIGPMTTAALREMGVSNIFESHVSTTEGMVKELKAIFQ